jgi:hypothetical protein
MVEEGEEKWSSTIRSADEGEKVREKEVQKKRRKARGRWAVSCEAPGHSSIFFTSDNCDAWSSSRRRLEFPAASCVFDLGGGGGGRGGAPLPESLFMVDVFEEEAIFIHDH